MFARGEQGWPVDAAVQIRTVAPASGRPCALMITSSLREPCAPAGPAAHSIAKMASPPRQAASPQFFPRRRWSLSRSAATPQSLARDRRLSMPVNILSSANLVYAGYGASSREVLWVVALATTITVQFQGGFTICGKTRKVVIPNAVRDLLLLKTKQIPHLGKNRRGSE